MGGQVKNKYIVLFVSFGWSIYKGLDVIAELAKMLTNDYQIVVVGTDNYVDEFLPNNVISIHRTQNQKQLAEIYTTATVFANPTREEMFGMVNIEALACGVPVVTFRTGGSPECLDSKSGIVVEKDDVDGMKDAIVEICERKMFNEINCIKRAQQFKGLDKFNEYIELYKNRE